MQGFVALCMLGLCIWQAQGYPNGPPMSACDSMFPAGHGYMAQNSVPPYKIHTAPQYYCPGQYVAVTLEIAKNNTYYEGVFVQARYAMPGATKPIGTWVKYDIAKLKTMSCDDNFASAISHSTKDKKYRLQAHWRAPLDATEDIYFMGTFVKETDEFWTGVKSMPLRHGMMMCPSIVSGGLMPTSSLALLVFTAAVLKMLWA